MRIVTLPNGRAVPLGSYVRAWRKVKDMEPEAELRGWEWYPVTAREILRDLRRGLQDRITQAVPYSQRGLEHVG